MSKIIEKYKKSLTNCIEVLKLSVKENKKTLFISLVLTILLEVQSIITVFLPAFLLELIMNKYDFKITILLIISYSFIVSSLNYLVSILKLKVTCYKKHFSNSMYYYLNSKATHIDYADCEDSTIEDLYFNAFDNVFKWTSIPFLIFSMICKLITIIIICFIYYRINIYIMIFLILSILIEFIFDYKYGRKNKDIEKDISEYSYKDNYINNCIHDYKIGKELRIFDAQKFLLSKYLKISNDIRNLEKKQNRISLFYESVSRVISFVRIIVIYIFAIQAYDKGLIPISDFMIYISSINYITINFWKFMSSINQIILSSAYFDDYKNYLSIMEKDREIIKSKDDFIIKENPIIEFRNVYFKYPNTDYFALKNVSFKIYENQKVAFIGDNGSGKSTIIKLILRLYSPDKGVILYKGKNIKTYDFDVYQDIFSVVFQDYQTYAYTILENITFDKSIDKEKIEVILNNVGLEKVINDIGLNTNYTKKFDENGVILSGGEEQKLAIARALYKNSNILILDEPTASIDPISEYALFKKVCFNNMKATAIFISHRMGSTFYADNIIVLNEGEVVEIGNFKELITKEGLYRKMYEMQSKYYERI